MRKAIVILSSACVCLLFGCAQREARGGRAEGPILFKFHVGQSHTFRMNVEVQTVAEAGGLAYHITTTLEMDLVQEVKSIRQDSLIDLMITFGDVTAKNVIEGQSFPMEEVLTLEGSTLEFTLSHGKVVDRKEPEVLKDMNTFGQNPFDQLEEIFNFLPRDTLLRVGDSWVRESEGERQSRKDVYTYESRRLEGDRDIAEFSIGTDMRDQGEIEFGPMTIELDLAGTGDGEVQFDVSEGLILRSERSISLDGEGSLVGAEGLADSARLSIDMNVALDLLE